MLFNFRFKIATCVVYSKLLSIKSPFKGKFLTPQSVIVNRMLLYQVNSKNKQELC